MRIEDIEADGAALIYPAPAKINLALHVVGQKENGHHLLESIVVFADAGDRIGICTSNKDRFTVSGRFGSLVPTIATGQDGNLVLKARDLLRSCLQDSGLAAGHVHLHLEKNLPVASGIGGGSADAAATLKGLMRYWGSEIDTPSLLSLALALGADVPMCLESRPLLAHGIGEEIAPIMNFPSLPILLVNPLVGVSTPVIFRLLTEKNNPPLHLPSGATTSAEWVEALKAMRNDLEPPARSLEPAIADVSAAIAGEGACLVRMSGSGATCFGLFADTQHRDTAAAALSARHPGWYVLACNTTA